MSTDPSIPPQLLQRILHEFMENKKTRISQPALNAVSEYIKIFAQEAIHRAAEKKKKDGGGAGGGLYLEVEDLEKIAPQLLLDF